MLKGGVAQKGTREMRIGTSANEEVDQGGVLARRFWDYQKPWLDGLMPMLAKMFSVGRR